MRILAHKTQLTVRHHLHPPVSVSAVRSNVMFSSSQQGSDHPRAIPAPEFCDIVKGPSLLRTSVVRPQPSLLHIPGLRSLPFWTQYDATQGRNMVAYQDASITFAVEHLESQWSRILDEYQSKAPKLRSDYETDTEHTLHQGTWEWHSYMSKGKLQGDFATHFPETFHILQALRDEGLLFEGTPFGYSFFSTLHARSSIGSHSAPMNMRVRLHLPLIVPSVSDVAETCTETKHSSISSSNERPSCGIRVGDKVREWIPGKVLVLDDAFNHEVWNETERERVLLLVDLWHPDVTRQERKEIIQLFEHAKAKGYMS